MSVNERLTNERLHEWEEYFQKLKKEEERKRLKSIIENGVIIDRCLSDYDVRLDCPRTNASEEIIVQYESKIYYLIVENEICEDQIIICENIKDITNELPQ